MRPDRLFGRTLAVLAMIVTALLGGAGAAFAVDYGQTGDGQGPGGSGGLAWTGAAAILPLSVIGGALVVLGVCLVIMMRRRASDRQ